MVLEERISRERFIRLGAALGVGAAGASVLAACGGGASNGGANGTNERNTGGDSGPVGETTAAEAPEETQAGGGSGAAIAAESDVAPGSAVEFEDGGDPAVLVRLDEGDFVAYSAVCTHQGCTVAYRNGELSCPCHGSVFDPANGAEVLGGPAESPLAEIPVEVRGGEVYRA
jgi:cytochrome b6-f complex iron-sulfur subunit